MFTLENGNGNGNSAQTQQIKNGNKGDPSKIVFLVGHGEKRKGREKNKNKIA